MADYTRLSLADGSAEPSNPNANPKQLSQALEGKPLLLLIVWDEKGSLPGCCVFSLKAVPTLEGQFLWQLERASRGNLQGQLFPLEDYCVYTGVGGRHAVGGCSWNLLPYKSFCKQSRSIKIYLLFKLLAAHTDGGQNQLTTPVTHQVPSTTPKYEVIFSLSEKKMTEKGWELIQRIFNAYANSSGWGFTKNLSRKTPGHLAGIWVSDAIFSFRCYLVTPHSIKELPTSDWLMSISVGHFLMAHCCVRPGHHGWYYS